MNDSFIGVCNFIRTYHFDWICYFYWACHCEQSEKSLFFFLFENRTSKTSPCDRNDMCGRDNTDAVNSSPLLLDEQLDCPCFKISSNVQNSSHQPRIPHCDYDLAVQYGADNLAQNLSLCAVWFAALSLKDRSTLLFLAPSFLFCFAVYYLLSCCPILVEHYKHHTSSWRTI